MRGFYGGPSARCVWVEGAKALVVPLLLRKLVHGNGGPVFGALLRFGVAAAVDRVFHGHAELNFQRVLLRLGRERVHQDLLARPPPAPLPLPNLRDPLLEQTHLHQVEAARGLGCLQHALPTPPELLLLVHQAVLVQKSQHALRVGQVEPPPHQLRERGPYGGRHARGAAHAPPPQALSVLADPRHARSSRHGQTIPLQLRRTPPTFAATTATTSIVVGGCRSPSTTAAVFWSPRRQRGVGRRLRFLLLRFLAAACPLVLFCPGFSFLLLPKPILEFTHLHRPEPRDGCAQEKAAAVAPAQRRFVENVLLVEHVKHFLPHFLPKVSQHPA
mmetsp:Transcript_6696/g.11242  ORF Transcript_6696/g.11242 Transcript_6696/m.11242 type:complete len:330 (+) Transcript_6696:206-1195(+)